MLKISTLFFISLAFVSCAAWAQDTKTGRDVKIMPQVGNGKICLDARGDADHDGVPIIIYHCNGGENQRWTVTSSEDNRHAIIGIGGYCMDVRGMHAAASGTPAELWKCHFESNQRFRFDPDGRIKEQQSSKCLFAPSTADRSPLVLHTCDNSAGEIFSLQH